VFKAASVFVSIQRDNLSTTFQDDDTNADFEFQGNNVVSP